MAAYLVVGNELLHGKRLYAETWDHKPPAIHYVYASAIAAVGYGPKAVLALGLLTASLTLLGVFVVGRELGGDDLTGVLSGIAFTLVCSDLGLEANQPNVEAFMNVCCVWFLALLLIGGRAKGGWRWGIALGAVGAAATLFKQASAPIVCIAGLCSFGALLWDEHRDSRTFWGQALSACAAIASAWLAVFAWFWAKGDWHSFYGAVFLYNRDYAGSFAASLRDGLASTHLFPSILWFSAPLAALSIVWVATALADRKRRESLVFAGAGLGTWLAVSLPAHFFPHYYQLWIPLLSIGAGAGAARLWAFSMSKQRWSRNLYATAVVATGIASIGLVIAHERRGLLTPAADWPLYKYPMEGPLFCEIPRMARWLDAHLGATESFFQWGLDPGLYYYSRRRPVTTLVSCHPLLRGPLVDELETTTLRQLEVGRPRFVAISRQLLGAGLSSPSLAWILANYRVVESAPSFRYYAVYERR